LHKRLASKLKKREARLRKGLERVDPLRLQSRLEFLLSVMEPVSWPDHPHQPPLFPMREGALEQAQTVLTNLTAPISGIRTLERFKAATDLELHSLRIAAKKSRYAMEMFSPIWPGGLSASIERARKFQELSGAYNDWSVLRSCFEDEIKRLDSPGSVGLAFEIGRLAAYAEQRKASMKAPIRAALIELQQSLSGLAAAFRLADSGRMATARSGRIRRQPKPQKAIPLASAGTDAA
jgi:CHAD domain-containing protein